MLNDDVMRYLHCKEYLSKMRPMERIDRYIEAPDVIRNSRHSSKIATDTSNPYIDYNALRVTSCG